MGHSCAQADAASGKLQLKDSGARLQEGISETAARLAQALSTLAQHDAAEPHWPAQCFQSSSLHFIDADGQVQVCALTADTLCLRVPHPSSPDRCERSHPCCPHCQSCRGTSHGEAYYRSGMCKSCLSS